MWFIFGIISLLTFTFYFGHKRYESNWVGMPASVSGKKYTHHTSFNKGKTQFIQLGCHTDASIDLTIKAETILDRFFKFLGISIEHQVGKDSFDEALYIINDHSVVCDILSQSEALQSEITRFVDACKRNKFVFKELHIRNKRIWAKVIPISKDNAPEATSIAKDIVPLLHLISDLFKANLPKSSPALIDPFYLKAAVFLAISTGMAIMGGIHLVTLWFIKTPFIVEWGKLFSMSLTVGTVLIVAIIIIMFMLLGRTARTHLVLIELLTIGYFGAISSTFTLARDVNIEWDKSPPQQHIVKVHNKSSVRHRRSSSYYLHVDDWTSPGQRKKLSVSSFNYSSFKIGDSVEIDQYPGYLGFAWVDDIKRYSGSY